MKTQTFGQWIDNLITTVFTGIGMWHALLHDRWDAGSFYVLLAILCQLPPRSLWRK